MHNFARRAHIMEDGAHTETDKGLISLMENLQSVKWGRGEGGATQVLIIKILA